MRQHSATMSPAVPRCSTSHDRLKASTKKWTEATLVGYQPAGQALYELRNCPECGSCLARPIEIVKLRYLRDARPALPRKCAA